MSELTQYLTESGHDNPNLKEELERLLPAHDVETTARAKREQMEADCCAVCSLCREGDAAWLDNDQWRTWRHGHEYFMYCCAHSIRAAWAEAHQEETERG